MSRPDPALADEDLLFRLLRQLDTVPDQSQRALASHLDISLGRLNALIRAASEAGFVDITDSGSTDRRSRHAYSLTTRGAAEKSRQVD